MIQLVKYNHYFPVKCETEYGTGEELCMENLVFSHPINNLYCVDDGPYAYL